MQGERCMMMNDAKKKITRNSNIGDLFPGRYSYENLGVVSTPLKCFLNDFGANGHLGYGRNGLVVHKGHWCFFVVAQSNYPVQPHYPGVGRGSV
jgi:hypothetical protein